MSDATRRVTVPSDGLRSLYDPVTLGSLELRNRFVMAPLTRSRAGADGVPGESAQRYYAQRASAGLIVSEGVTIAPEAKGNPDVPGIFTSQQVEAWKPIVAAVHEGGGLIVAQLWHTGRGSHPIFLPEGQLPVGPSAIRISGDTYTHDGPIPYVMPRALALHEISPIVEQYAQAARNAIDAGFDGIELHGANGYLIDQFLQDCANQRDDEYGGSRENRARFLLEVVDATGAAIGSSRVGVRISPSSTFQDMDDSDPEALFGMVLARLSARELAYVHLVEPGISGAESVARRADAIDSAWARERYTGNIVAAGGYDQHQAGKALAAGSVDAVAFGRLFLANPDLPERFAQNAPLNVADPATFYGGDDRGYVDYPALELDRGQLRA